jgi:hypothetical protein
VGSWALPRQPRRLEPPFRLASANSARYLQKVGATMSGWLRFVLAVLATWRVTHLLASEDGPGDLVVRFRAALGETWAGKLLDCFYCLSLWIAAPAALFVSGDWAERFLSWPAVSGGACLLERAFKEAVVIEPMPATEQGELNHVLRTETPNADPLPADSSSDRAFTTFR